MKHKARELADHFAAQPEQKPVGEVVEVNNDGFRCEFSQHLAVGTKLYTFPPAAQRPWVGLTEFQFAEIYNKWNDTNGSTPWGLNQALEAKLRKLNK